MDPESRGRWVELLDRVTDAVASAAEAVSGSIWNQIWNQPGLKSRIGHSGDSEVPDSIGGPSRTRTLDPLIKRRGPVMSRPSSFFAHLRVTARFVSAFAA